MNLAFRIASGEVDAKPLPGSLRVNRRLAQWLRFHPEGFVEVSSGKVEIGQGILTALAQIAAEELDISLERLHALRRAASTPASLDTPLADDSERTRADLVSDEPALATMQSAGEQDDLADQVEAALGDLPPREREVLRLHYGLGNAYGASLSEIGTRLGVTRERARQIEGQALRKLRGDRRLRRALVDLQTA